MNINDATYHQLNDIACWLRHLLGSTHGRQSFDERGHVVNTYTVIEAPDWEARQKLAEIEETITAVRNETGIPILIELLERICKTFLDMQAQGARCRDVNLMEDLDRELGAWDRGRQGDRRAR